MIIRYRRYFRPRHTIQHHHWGNQQSDLKVRDLPMLSNLYLSDFVSSSWSIFLLGRLYLNVVLR